MSNSTVKILNTVTKFLFRCQVFYSDYYQSLPKSYKVGDFPVIHEV